MAIPGVVYNIVDKFCNFVCYIPLILVGLIGLCILVVIHEFGHFIFAKLFNVFVPSFSIGFGPRLIEKKIGETVFAISAIPLGGYVEIAGAAEVGQGEQLHAKRQDERSFNAKPYWQKMVIISAGIIINFLFAYIVFTLLLYAGSPCIGTWCNSKAPFIGYVIKEKPADKAGLKPKDKILEINNTKINTISNFNEVIPKYINKKVEITFLRDNKKEKATLEVQSQKVGNKEVPIIGVLWYTEPVSFVESIKQGFELSWYIIKEMFSIFKNLSKAKESLGGPLILITYLTQFAGKGLKTFSYLLAIISINLAVFNIIPLPIFDGGQALFYTVEAILGRPLSDEIRQKIHYVTWILVIILIIFLTYNDLLKIFRK